MQAERDSSKFPGSWDYVNWLQGGAEVARVSRWMVHRKSGGARNGRQIVLSECVCISIIFQQTNVGLDSG